RAPAAEADGEVQLAREGLLEEHGGLRDLYLETDARVLLGETGESARKHLVGEVLHRSEADRSLEPLVGERGHRALAGVEDLAGVRDEQLAGAGEGLGATLAAEERMPDQLAELGHR